MYCPHPPHATPHKRTHHTLQEMDQIYNYLKQKLCDVRAKILKERMVANEATRADRRQRAANGEVLPKIELEPLTISVRKDLGTLLHEPLDDAMTERHMNSAAMNVGAYPATRADIDAEGVMQSSTHEEFINIVNENKRIAEEMTANNIRAKFARPDLWVGSNDKIGGRIIIDDDASQWPFNSTGACDFDVGACVWAHACGRVRVRACM